MSFYSNHSIPNFESRPDLFKTNYNNTRNNTFNTPNINLHVISEIKTLT